MSNEATGETVLIAKFNFDATEPNELSMKKGDKLRLIDNTQTWWQVMSAKGIVGYVPSNFVKIKKNGMFSSLRNTLGRSKNKKSDASKKLPVNGNYKNRFSSNDTERQTVNYESNQDFNTNRSSMPEPAFVGLVDEFNNISQSTFLQNNSKTFNRDTFSPVNNHNNSNSKLCNDVIVTTNKNGATKNLPIVTDNVNWSPPAYGQQPDQSDFGNNSRGSEQTQAVSGLDECEEVEYDARQHCQDVQNDCEYCVALFPYEPQNEDELALEKGDEILVYRKCSDGWWEGRKVKDFKEGWFPQNYTTPLKKAPVTQSFNLEEKPSTKGDCVSPPKEGPDPAVLCIVKTLYPFVKSQEGELSFQMGEKLSIVQKPPDDPDWWLAVNDRHEMGLVPSNYISVVSQQQHVTLPQSKRLCYCMANSVFYTRSWYWGSISRPDTEALLEKGSKGDFVVRDSETNPGSYTVTLFTGKRCRHFKVVLMDNRYHIGQKTFPSMDELLLHYTKSPIFKNESEIEFLCASFEPHAF